MLAVSRRTFTNIYSDIEHSAFYAAYQFALSIRWSQEVQASHYAIAAHRLVVLTEVNTVSQDRRDLLFKLSLAEALEEVATSIAEEAWLYNEDAIYFCFNYIHDSNLSSYIRFSKTYPSFLTVKEGSTSHLGLLSSGEKKETALLGARNRYALRLADHQRSSPGCAGWDRQGEREFIVNSLQLAN